MPSEKSSNINVAITIPMQPILGGYEYTYQNYGLLAIPEPAFFFVPNTKGVLLF